VISKDKIQRILKEETLDFGKRTKSEKMIEMLIKHHFDFSVLPEVFYDIIVDIYEDNPIRGTEMSITFLMKKTFTEKQSDEVHKMSRRVREFIKSHFGDEFNYIQTSNSTIDSYMDFKGYYDNKKE
jgi:hypothetical protein